MRPDSLIGRGPLALAPGPIALGGVAVYVAALFPDYYARGQPLWATPENLGYNIAWIVAFGIATTLLLIRRPGAQRLGSAVLIGVAVVSLPSILDDVIQVTGETEAGAGFEANLAALAAFYVAATLSSIMLIRDASVGWRISRTRLLVAGIGAAGGVAYASSFALPTFTYKFSRDSGGSNIFGSTDSSVFFGHLGSDFALMLLTICVVLSTPILASLVRPPRVGAGLIGGLVLGVTAEVISDAILVARTTGPTFYESVKETLYASTAANSGFVWETVGLGILVLCSALAASLPDRGDARPAPYRRSWALVAAAIAAVAGATVGGGYLASAEEALGAADAQACRSFDEFNEAARLVSEQQPTFQGIESLRGRIRALAADARLAQDPRLRQAGQVLQEAVNANYEAEGLASAARRIAEVCRQHG